MNKHIRNLLAIMLCVSLVGGLAACGTSPAPSSTVSAPSTSTSTPTPESVKPAEPVEVVFWHSFSGATGEAFQQIIDGYNNGPGKEKSISVTAVFQGYEGTNKVILAYQTKDTANAPDINVGLTSTIPSMMDMDWSVSAEKYMTAAGAEVTKDTFYPALQRSCSYEGEMVAVPFANSIPLLYYNVELLKAAGYTEPPKTMDEMVEYVNKLTVKDGNNVTRYGLNMQTKRYHLTEFCVSQNPNAFFGDNEGGRVAPMTKITAGEDGTLKAYLEKLDKLVKTGGYKFVEDKINEEFAQELSAMVIMSSSRLGTMDGLMAGKYMTAFLPKVNEGDSSGAAIGGSCLNLFDRGDPARVDAAWDVIRYLVNPENQAAFAQVSGYIPVNVASENLPTMQDYYKEKPQYKVALDQMKSAHPNAQEPLDLTYNEINGIITEVMLEFCQGKLTVDQTVEKIVSSCNASLDEYHAANG